MLTLLSSVSLQVAWMEYERIVTERLKRLRIIDSDIYRSRPLSSRKHFDQITN